MKEFIYIFLGGGLGSVLRYSIYLLIPPTSFPSATFIVNSVGSFLIGYFIALANSNSSFLSNHQSYVMFLTIGLCGGFTTFSSFSKENYTLLQQQQFGLFFLYIVLSILVCLGGTALGYFLGK